MAARIESRWDPGQYLRFADHRLRPALELLGRVPLEEPDRIVDLGCGAGNVTRFLRDRWPGARVVGVDHSREMLAEAKETSSEVRWIEADVAVWEPTASEEPLDLVFSNATLHWIDGHAELFPRLLSLVRSGGYLAVQMPLSWGAPSHGLMRETLAGGGPDGAPIGCEALRAELGRKWVLEPAEYFDLLEARSAWLDVWTTRYWHVLEGEDPVLEWVRGTGLRPVLQGLEGDAREAFLARYRGALRAAYPPRADGRTLYPFERLFVVAERA